MEATDMARRTRTVEELRRLSTVDAEPADDTRAEQDCNHFSLRGYVAQLQKKDPKLCSLQIFRNEQQCDEHNNNASPLSVSKYHKWNCSRCLDRVKVSGPRTTSTSTSEAVSMQHQGINDDCSISIVRIVPKNVDSRRLFSCAQRPSQAIDRLTLSKSAQECNSDCSSPGDKAITAVNVPASLAEENVPETFVETSIPVTKDLPVSPNNIDLSASILNDAPMNVNNLPDDVPQVMAGAEENVLQSPCNPKSCVVPNEDQNATAIVANDDPNVPSVSGQGSRHKSNHVLNQGPPRSSLKRNVGSDDKKKGKKSNDLADNSDKKLCQRKPQKTRLLSEIIDTDQIGVSANAVQVDHAHSVDLGEGDQVGVSANAVQVDHAHGVDLGEGDNSRMPLEVGKDNDIPNQKMGKIQSRAVKNKAKHIGVDKVDDGSSLMNWLKTSQKKVRTEKKDLGHKNLDSSAVSHSNPDIVASHDMHHDVLPSVGDMGQGKALSTVSAKHGNENAQNNMEGNIQEVDDRCQNESVNLKRRLLNDKSTILLKRKVLSTSVACDGNSTMNRDMLRSRDSPQMESEGRCQAKVSHGKDKIQNLSGLRRQNIPKNKKKRKPEVHEKQNMIDDFPMDIVELLAAKHRERRLTSDTDSLENSPKVAEVDCAKSAAKDCPIDASNELGTNFQKPLSLGSKQKSLQGHASSSTEAANVNLQDLHTQKSSECHAASNTEVSNDQPPESQMQNSFQVHALPITGSFNMYPPKVRVVDGLDYTQEQQAHLHRDEEVTIACTSPIFSHQQHIAEVPARCWNNNREKKLMWDSFKTASRNSPTSSYGFQFRNRVQEIDSAPIHAYGASSNYAAQQPVIAAVDHYTKEAIPSTALTMEAGRLYDHRIAGQSGLYPKEPMPATHLLRLMDSSTAAGFTNYQRANRRQMELQSQALGSQYTQHDQYNASPSISYGSHVIEKAPLTLHDLSRRQVQQNLHRPLRPHPRVGVLGSLLQQDIANWSENYGGQPVNRLGVSKGTASLDMNRKGNYETLNSGSFSAGWNALQLGSVSSASNPEYRLPGYATSQPSTSGKGKTVHPLDKLVRKDICVTNRNPADFTVISDRNEYMRNL